MNKRELGIKILTRAETGFNNIYQMIIACEALAIKYNDAQYVDNKKTIERQIQKFETKAIC